MHLLSEYALHVGAAISPADGEKKISSVTNKSSDAGQGGIFCAIRGATADGNLFIPDAVRQGVSAIVSDSKEALKNVPDGVVILQVPDAYSAWARLCETYLNYPARRLSVHGITGTNGKTTCAYVLKQLISAVSGENCALVSTVSFDAGNGVRKKTNNTTPDAMSLQKIFSRIVECGTKNAVMECSSHGLAQNRTGSLKFASAVFTNLTGDHLDYHKTMENYFAAKERLFTENLAPNAPAVINTDDEYGKRLADVIAKGRGNAVKVSYSSASSECFIKDIILNGDSSDVSIVLDGRPYGFRVPFPGRHNVYNVVESLAAAYYCFPDAEKLVAEVEKLSPAPGRLQKVELPSGAKAYVDYAHTDDALDRVLSSLKSIIRPGGRIITVFGCGGDRDRTKRPRMCRVAERLSDVAVVTSDNPRSEDPLAIIDEMLAGAEDRKNFIVEPDRAKAIRLAVSMAEENDVVLVAGKGHEDYQEIKGVRHHFDDVEELLKVVSCLK